MAGWKNFKSGNYITRSIQNPNRSPRQLPANPRKIGQRFCLKIWVPSGYGGKVIAPCRKNIGALHRPIPALGMHHVLA
jgi:hypothetical protein